MSANSHPVEKVECDLLVIGGGMAGCGAIYESKYWGKDLNVVLVEKANMDRSGAVAQGLSAINLYLGDNTPEQYVNYVRNDLMGIIREDLVYDVATHVDSSVNLFDKWGLPIWKDANGKYVREGKWQIMINGESYKPIVSEAAKKTASHVYERIFITNLLPDAKNPNRVAGAIGFGVRDGKCYVFKSKAVILAAGGAVHLWRPRSVGEGMGRAWYPPWNTGTSFALMIQAGAEMTQMENRFVPSRYKDGYGPVGAWFLLLKTRATNAYGEDYLTPKVEGFTKKYGPGASNATCLRNHAMLEDIKAGKGPILMHTEEVLTSKEKEQEGWEDFLDMTISQAGVWASQNVDPTKRPSEITLSEPYVMGSHAGCAGAWVSGPASLSPEDYNWGYNRMTTVEGLFTAGDGVGACPHKFSSGSHAEGRIAAKGAVQYISDHKAEAPEIDERALESSKASMFLPLEVYEKGKAETTKSYISPSFFTPDLATHRLQKIMDEYCGGVGSYYTTNEPLLNRGLELLTMMKEDIPKLGAEDFHHLMRVHELIHRVWTAEAVIRHTQFRKETRWPGYYYRADYPDIDNQNFKCFVNSKYDPKTGEWKLFTRPYKQMY